MAYARHAHQVQVRSCPLSVMLYGKHNHNLIHKQHNRYFWERRCLTPHVGKLDGLATDDSCREAPSIASAGCDSKREWHFCSGECLHDTDKVMRMVSEQERARNKRPSYLRIPHRASIPTVRLELPREHLSLSTWRLTSIILLPSRHHTRVLQGLTSRPGPEDGTK